SWRVDGRHRGAAHHADSCPSSGVNDSSTRETIARVYREESARALATLIRLLGDFDVAEEALQDAFTIAVTQWERDGAPANPRAWLISTGRNRTVDRIR